MKKILIVLFLLSIVTLMNTIDNNSVFAQTFYGINKNTNSPVENKQTNLNNMSNFFQRYYTEVNKTPSAKTNNTSQINTFNNSKVSNQSRMNPLDAKIANIRTVLQAKGALKARPKSDFSSSIINNYMDLGDLYFIKCFADINRKKYEDAFQNLYYALLAYRDFSDPCSFNSNFNRDFLYFDLTATYLLIKLHLYSIAKDNLKYIINRNNNKVEVKRMAMMFYNIIESGTIAGKQSILFKNFGTNSQKLTLKAQRDLKDKEEFLLQYIWDNYIQARRERGNYCSQLI